MKISGYGAVLITLLSMLISSCSDPARLTDDVTSQAQVSDASTRHPAWNELHCVTAVEADCGSGSGEFGCEEPPFCFYDLVITNTGEIFVGDEDNGRIIKYSEDSTEPIEIYLPVEYRDIGFFSPSLDKEYLYLLLRNNNILILSIEGEFHSIIDMEEYEPFFPVNLIADWQGGFFILLYHYEYPNTNDFQLLHYIDDTNIELYDIAGGFGDEFKLGMVLGKNGKLYSSDNGRIYSTELGDCGPFDINDWGFIYEPYLVNPSEHESIDVNIPLPNLGLEFVQFILNSVDQEGRFYVLINAHSYIDHSRIMSETLIGLVRLNNQGEIMDAGLFPEEWRDAIIPYLASIGPDGSLYATAYDRNDLSVQPKIVRCKFQGIE
jgi:hypothetical protein